MPKANQVPKPAKVKNWVAAQPLKQRLLDQANQIGDRKRLSLSQVTKLMIYGAL